MTEVTNNFYIMDPEMGLKLLAAHNIKILDNANAKKPRRKARNAGSSDQVIVKELEAEYRSAANHYRHHEDLGDFKEYPRITQATLAARTKLSRSTISARLKAAQANGDKLWFLWDGLASKESVMQHIAAKTGRRNAE